MTTLSDFVNSGASNQAQVDANTNAIKALAGRNVIRNGHMTIAQRGTSFPAAVSNLYTLDGWVPVHTTTAVTTISQDADSPSPYKFNSYKIAVTTADATIASGEFYMLNQYIEGHNIKNFFGKTFTLSFWVKSSKVGKYGVAFRNTDYNQVYASEYTINVANTWEKKSITVIGGLPNVGTWDTATGVGIRLTFFLAAATDVTTSTLNSWVTGGKPVTSNQVNLLDTVGTTWFLTGVQLEIGEQATEFEITSIPDEIAKSLRYYEVLTLSAASPSTSTSGNIVASANFKVHKRVVPDITKISNGFYPPIGVAAATTFIANTHSVIGFKACNLTGSHEFSEIISASAEL